LAIQNFHLVSGFAGKEKRFSMLKKRLIGAVQVAAEEQTTVEVYGKHPGSISEEISEAGIIWEIFELVAILRAVATQQVEFLWR
jgi:hypothetical protein